MNSKEQQYGLQGREDYHAEQPPVIGPMLRCEKARKELQHAHSCEDKAQTQAMCAFSMAHEKQDCQQRVDHDGHAREEQVEWRIGRYQQADEEIGNEYDEGNDDDSFHSFSSISSFFLLYSSSVMSCSSSSPFNCFRRTATSAGVVPVEVSEVSCVLKMSFAN